MYHATPFWLAKFLLRNLQVATFCKINYSMSGGAGLLLLILVGVLCASWLDLDMSSSSMESKVELLEAQNIKLSFHGFPSVLM